ncbi:MAG: chloride channel protein [Dysgonamonadaceae bacterium]|jgi:CIC family chloride channel protein|nr:chloride channel protein [Dysgonamonadaceae bacterium]
MAKDKKNTWFDAVLLWREKHISERYFILLLSFVIGIATALAAYVLKEIIHIIQHLLTANAEKTQANYIYLIYPVIGILLSGLFVKFIVRDDIGHGVTKILYAISQRKSRIKRHNMWSSLVASSITIGFGGSVGAEAPIVLTGSAIGSNLGRMFKMEQKTLMLLVGCGAAGAIAGIFKAPIAGLLFTIEVLMLDLTTTSVLPLLTTSVTAATVSYILTGTEAMFKFQQTEVFSINRIPYVLLLGIICGLVALYFTRTTTWFESKLRKIEAYWKKFLICGVLLSLLIFLLPPLYGEGYDTIGALIGLDYENLMDGSLFYPTQSNLWGIVLFMLLIILTKVFATCATNGGGGCGGVFAPSLFLGSIVGFAFAHSTGLLLDTVYLPQENFALMGMAGMMAAIMHSPLTAVFLIAELTGGYDLFLPLMIVTISAFATILCFERYSLYSIRLAQKGELLTHHKDKAVLTLLNLNSVIENDIKVVHPKMYLRDVINAISHSTRNVFAVTDDEGVLRGIVLLDDIRNIMFRRDLYDRFKVKKFMVSPPAKININMPMEKIMQLFDDTKAWNLPVIDNDGKYLGFVSKAKIFNAYREVLVDNFSADE